MPADDHNNPNINVKYVRIWTHTELSELLNLAARYTHGPDFDIKQRQLVDLSALVDAKAVFRDVFALYGFYKRTFGHPVTPIPVAISAPAGLGYGLARMFSALTASHRLMRVGIFSTLPEAAASLNITADILHNVQGDLEPGAL